jgi:hypothetical protein
MDILLPDFEQFVRDRLRAALDEGKTNKVAKKPKAPKGSKKKKKK